MATEAEHKNKQTKRKRSASPSADMNLRLISSFSGTLFKFPILTDDTMVSTSSVFNYYLAVNNSTLKSI